jgi:hypothetical protein
MIETQTAPMADRLMGVHEVAELLDQSPRTIRRYAKDGILRLFRSCRAAT